MCAHVNKTMKSSAMPPDPRMDEAELQRYLDGRMEPEEHQALEERLQASAAARRTLDALREEEKLLRGALENVAEPPYKIADRVMAVIYSEHHRQQAAWRARRFRIRLVSALSAAALLMLAFYFIKPLEQAGQYVGGTGAAVARHGAAPEPLEKNDPYYEGDTLVTGRGQFARLRLSEGTQVDLDENSRLELTKVRQGDLALTLEAGRFRALVGSANIGFVLKTPAGSIKADSGSSFEAWLVQRAVTHDPSHWCGPWAPEAPTTLAANDLVCLTVLGGAVSVYTPESPRGVQVEATCRVAFGPSRSLSVGETVREMGALDARREAWAASDGTPVEDRALLGLVTTLDWIDLARRFEMNDPPGGADTLKKLREALHLLAAANGSGEASARAVQLGRGQQALRAVVQGFPLAYEGRRCARVLEGLAHFERGRALLSAAPAEATSAPSAFLAAYVAFEEALHTTPVTDQLVQPAVGLADLKLKIKVESGTRLCDLSADEQALLLARFYQPWALLRLKTLAPHGDAGLPEGEGSQEVAVQQDTAACFEQAEKLLGRAMEALGARYGKALAFAQVGRVKDALVEFDMLCTASVAGCSAEPRAWVEGLRQAAHLERVRLHATADEALGAKKASEEFQLRYPLDLDGSVHRAIRILEGGCLASCGEQALRQLKFGDALLYFQAAFERGEAIQTLPAEQVRRLRLGHLEAAVMTDNGREAFRVLAKLGKVPVGQSDIERIREEALSGKARALYEIQKAAGFPKQGL